MDENQFPIAPEVIAAIMANLRRIVKPCAICNAPAAEHPVVVQIPMRLLASLTYNTLEPGLVPMITCKICFNCQTRPGLANAIVDKVARLHAARN